VRVRDLDHLLVFDAVALCHFAEPPGIHAKGGVGAPDSALAPQADGLRTAIRERRARPAAVPLNRSRLNSQTLRTPQRCGGEENPDRFAGAEFALVLPGSIVGHASDRVRQYLFHRSWCATLGHLDGA
jgi:hypothetical protein